MSLQINSFRKKTFAAFLIFLILFHSMGCQYYKAKPAEKSDYEQIMTMGEIHKYFIVHADNKTFALNDIQTTKTEISGTLSEPEEKIFYNEERKKRIKKGEGNIVNEVHLYLKDQDFDLETGQVDFPMSDINEIRIIDRNTGKEIAVYALIGIGALAVASAIAAATKSSCPYVYVFNGENYVFEGEIYGGAIGKNLERTDYMPLPSLKMNEGSYTIRLSNELKERQYTNLLELLLVEHPAYEKILLDKNGKPQLVGNAVMPTEAYSSNQEDLLPLLTEKDDRKHLFDDTDVQKNTVVLSFDKPSDADQANLVLKGKNTLWFDYLFGEFLEKFGVSYADWMKKQSENDPADRMRRIHDSDFPLSVSIWDNDKWRSVDDLMTVGPLASREFVIPMDIRNLDGNEIRIKLQTGFMFWELDYAAMDFRVNTNLNSKVIRPFVAIGTGSIDWKYALERSDHQYMAQENTGDVTEILFTVPDAMRDRPHTAFLKVQGYYELVRDFEGLPEWTQLRKFKVPGYFSEFSKERYLEVAHVDYDIASN